MSTPASSKVHVVLNASGQVALVSRIVEYKPAKAGDDSELTFGVVAEPGQTVIEVELPANEAKLDGSELLAHVAKHAAVQAALGRFPGAQAAGKTASDVASSEGITAGTL